MNLAKYIDHTMLKADATEKEIHQLIEEAKKYHFASVCVNPYWVLYAANQLANTDVAVCTVIGFPLGANTTELKAYEAAQAISNGADEIDMVINIGALKDEKNDLVREDIKAVVDASKGHLVKVIIETCLLNQEEKERACLLAKEAGAHYVKTSTGFSSGGATVEDVALMKSVVKEDLKVKASGGIKDEKAALAMIAAGASRIGTSNGIKIVKK